MGRRNRTAHRARTGLVVVAMLIASVPLIVAPALAGKPPKDSPPPETVATGFQSVETAGGYLPSGQTLDIPVPADANAGDFLIAQIGYSASGTIAPPAGWNLIDVTTNPSKSIMQGLYWRSTSASEPTHYSFQTRGASRSDTPTTGAIAAYSGIDLTNPIDAVGAQSNGATTDVSWLRRSPPFPRRPPP